MQGRLAVGFAVKAVVALTLLALLWQRTGVSRAYHDALVTAANTAIGATGHEGRLSAVGNDFVYHGRQEDRRVRVSVSAGRITANLVLLAALFIASPVRPCRRLYGIFLAAAFGGMFILHVVTVLVHVKHGLLKMPHEPGGWDGFVQTYVGAYSYVGLWAFVIVAWCPYILLYAANLRRNRERSGARPR